MFNESTKRRRWLRLAASAMIACGLASVAAAQSVVIDAAGGLRVPGVSIQSGAVGGIASTEDKGFVNTNLDKRMFKGQNLSGWSFVNVSARSSNFEGADLSGTSFTNADLAQANLRQANLRGAEFINVNLQQADLSGAVWTDGRRCAPQSIGRCR